MTADKNKEQANDEGKIQIKRTNFDRNKNAIKGFSEKLPSTGDLPTVAMNGGLFGLFDYDVKGEDLNKLTESIQDKMLKQNNILIKIIKEFNIIYDTFASLDEGYIQSILMSVKAAQEANHKAIKSIEGVNKNQAQIRLDQEDIKQLINKNKQVILVLKAHKEKLDKIDHLGDIDKLFFEFATFKEEMVVFSDRLEELNVQQNQEIVIRQRQGIVTSNLKEKINRLDDNFERGEKNFNNQVVHFQQELNENNKVIKQELSEKDKQISNVKKIFSKRLSDIQEKNKNEAKIYDRELKELTRNLKITKYIAFFGICTCLLMFILVISGVL
jgi:hypothetical protein